MARSAASICPHRRMAAPSPHQLTIIFPSPSGRPAVKSAALVAGELVQPFATIPRHSKTNRTLSFSTRIPSQAKNLDRHFKSAIVRRVCSIATTLPPLRRSRGFLFITRRSSLGTAVRPNESNQRNGIFHSCRGRTTMNLVA